MNSTTPAPQAGDFPRRMPSAPNRARGASGSDAVPGLESGAFFPAIPGQAESLIHSLLPETLPRLGAWARWTIDALPVNQAQSAGWYSLMVGADGHVFWQHPNSNSAERITAFLWLADELGDPDFERCAEHYAQALLDPVTGLYQGPEEDGRGMLWYWRDVGLYMTNYTMRVPGAMLSLARRTGNAAYRDAALLAGEQLLRSQQPSGILRAGWAPREPGGAQSVLTPDLIARWLPPGRINSRVGYTVAAFAALREETGDLRYQAALDRLVDAFARLQHPDGSFPKEILTDRVEALDPSVKSLFLGYIMDGFGAVLCLQPEHDRLRRTAVQLGEFFVGRIRQTGTLFYGDTHCGGLEFERDWWQCARPEGITGLIDLSTVTGDPVYREAACRIILPHLLNVASCPDQPDLHGGLLSWRNLPGRGVAVPGYSHFRLLLALEALCAK